MEQIHGTQSTINSKNFNFMITIFLEPTSERPLELKSKTMKYANN